MQASAAKSLERFRSALAAGEKRAAIAADIGVSEGQLSKLLSGDIRRFCQIAACLGLEVVKTDYVDALERILRERL